MNGHEDNPPTAADIAAVRVRIELQEMAQADIKTITGVSNIPPPAEPDMINHPPHYKGKDGTEAIDVVESWRLGPAGHLFNAVTYVLRHQGKDGLKDLKKARWYVARVIEKKLWMPPHCLWRSEHEALSIAHAFGLNDTLAGVLAALQATLCGLGDWDEQMKRALELLDAEIASRTGEIPDNRFAASGTIRDLEPAVEPVDPGWPSGPPGGGSST